VLQLLARRNVDEGRYSVYLLYYSVYLLYRHKVYYKSTNTDAEGAAGRSLGVCGELSLLALLVQKYIY
jgi:hypothetical protein